MHRQCSEPTLTQTFDTANTYSAGESEVILGKFLKAHQIPRESVVIMTKTYNTDGKLEDKGPAGWTNHNGLSRKVHLVLACMVREAALTTAHLRVGQGFAGAPAARLHRRPPVPPLRL